MFELIELKHFQFVDVIYGAVLSHKLRRNFHIIFRAVVDDRQEIFRIVFEVQKLAHQFLICDRYIQCRKDVYVNL